MLIVYSLKMANKLFIQKYVPKSFFLTTPAGKVKVNKLINKETQLYIHANKTILFLSFSILLTILKIS